MHIPKWWKDANNDLEDGCVDAAYSCYWYYICAVYGVVGIFALVQLIRIQLRVPTYGWTIQKVFHLLNFVICLIRALTFGLYQSMNDLEDALGSFTVQLIIFDIASLLFFTTYTLLVLFWAEIYHHAFDSNKSKLKPYFLITNVVVYIVQIVLWLLTIPDDTQDEARYVSAGWMTFVFMVAVTGFLLYGGRLFFMLIKFPIDARGRQKKLLEIGIITLISSFCFIARAAFMFMYILDKKDFDLDLMKDHMLNIVFYAICEILPAVCVLFVLRRLPAKPTKSQSGVYDPLEPRED